MKRIALLLFLASLLAIGVAACGAASQPETKMVALNTGDDLTFRSIGIQSGPVEVKIIFTNIGVDDSPTFYFQAFSDDVLMETNQFLYSYDIFPGLEMEGRASTQQLLLNYDPTKWEVKP